MQHFRNAQQHKCLGVPLKMNGMQRTNTHCSNAWVTNILWWEWTIALACLPIKYHLVHMLQRPYNGHKQLWHYDDTYINMGPCDLYFLYSQ